jgi:hypothetical protein
LTFTRTGNNEIILQMNEDQWETLLILTGIALGAYMQRGDRQQFWRTLEFINKLNAGNPDFTPYEIPGESTDGSVV